MARFQEIEVVDSHTAGEPTRVVLSGGLDLGDGALFERRERFRREFDDFRSAVVNEPRGSDVLVGALLCPPTNSECAAGVIFFNNVGVIGMCGHGTIGVVITLGHLGRIGAGAHRIETPVGIVTVEYDGDSCARFENVPCYRHRKDVVIDAPGIGPITGDVAWGGNWFFLVNAGDLRLDAGNAEFLTTYTREIREALRRAGVTGADGHEIDHIELVGPPHDAANNARNFVLCPGGAYDRSPCGTGLSAKLACLYEDGLLKPGEIWRQESVIGSVFEGSVKIDDGNIIPAIAGRAFVTAYGKLILNSADPFCYGVRPSRCMTREKTTAD